VLPSGRLLVPLSSQHKVVEYDPDGKLVWEAPVAQPSGVFRLANGNTLVACHAAQRVVEIDRSGRVVWEYKTDGAQPWRARRR